MCFDQSSIIEIDLVRGFIAEEISNERDDSIRSHGHSPPSIAKLHDSLASLRVGFPARKVATVRVASRDEVVPVVRQGIFNCIVNCSVVEQGAAHQRCAPAQALECIQNLAAMESTAALSWWSVGPVVCVDIALGSGSPKVGPVVCGNQALVAVKVVGLVARLIIVAGGEKLIEGIGQSQRLEDGAVGLIVDSQVQRETRRSAALVPVVSSDDRDVILESLGQNLDVVVATKVVAIDDRAEARRLAVRLVVFEGSSDKGRVEGDLVLKGQDCLKR